MILIIILVIWALCGVIATGSILAHSQQAFPRLAKVDFDTDCAEAVVYGLAGPLGLITALLTTGMFRYGLQFRPLKKGSK